MQPQITSDIFFTQRIGEAESSLQLLQALPVAVYTCEMNGYITMYNKAAAVLWGREPELGKDLWCGSWRIFRLDGTILPLDESPMAIVLKGKIIPERQEIIIQRPDGSKRNVISHPRPILDSSGGITGAVNTLMDVTERNIAEKDAANLVAIVQSSEDAIVSKTLDGIVTSWNPGAERLFGYTADEMIGQPILKILPPDRLREEPTILERIRKGERVEHFYTIRQTKQGKLIDISLTISPIRDSDGRIIGASKIARNVTDTIIARKKLEQSEERLQMALQATQLGTWDFHPLTGELNWSEECKKIYGLPPGQQIDFNVFSEHIYVDDRQYVETAIQKSMNPSGTGDYDISYRILRFDDNAVRWIRAQGKVYFNPLRQAELFTGTVVDITEQKQSQQALEESEQRIRLAVEAAKMGTFDWDLVSNDFKSSQRLNDIFGYQGQADISHLNLIESFHPDDKPVRDKAVADAPEKGSLSYEARIYWPDRSIRWIKVFGKIIYGNKGEALRMYGTVVDTTEEKKTLKSLEENEQRLNIVIQAAELGTWELNLLTRELIYSERYLQILGFASGSCPAHEVILMKIHPDDLDIRNKAIKEALIAGFLDFEMRIKPTPDTVRWIRSRGRVFFDEKNVPWRILGTTMDITEQKAAFSALQASELLFKTIANVSPVGLWMTDVNGKNNFVNDTWVDWTGIPITSQYDEGWIGAVLDTDREYVLNVCKKSFETKENFAVEFRIRRRDGQVRWMLSEGGPYYTINKEFSGFAGSVADITERKQQEMQKNDFLAVASHELKTPITSIKAYTQLLAKTYEKTDNDFLKNALGKMESQVNKMTKLVSDFLKLSKIESGKLQLNSETFNLNELVHEVVDDIQMVSGNHKILVNEDTPVKVLADRERIAQVINNFLNNAVKYSPDNKHISVKIEHADGVVTVSVTDKGIGIKPEEHDKIFERFYRARANTNTSFSGFGIGLYICAEIIRRHNGKIGVTSKEGKGASFYFALPVID
ncbi:MAG: PAS domain S-box protein [Chitinophagaceae bacterium]